VNHLLIGIAAGLGACVAALLVLLAVLVRRSSRRADQRVGHVVATLEARVDELAVELAQAVARAEDESRRNRFLGEIAGSIDLDAVLARTLEAATALPGSHAALIRLEAADGAPVVAAHGLPVEEASQQTIAGPPDGRRPRAVELGYRYAEDAADGTSLVRGGLAVPLEQDGTQLGYLTVYTRDAGRRYDDEDVRRLEDLAERASPALENARRFREVRQLADLDALTGLHNRRFFHETLARECSRAQRYTRRMALLVFDIDDFKSVNDRIGHLAGDAALAEAAERVKKVVRVADIACRVGGDEFAVILPESGVEEAGQLFARIQGTISNFPIGDVGRLKISAGIAELQREDDAISLFERADEALYRAKGAGKGQSAIADSRRTA
jgi:diguanylate cyclase (GGDEF)-like protein